MSALTDYFSSLANKFRSKTGKSNTLTPDDMVDEVDAVYQKGYDDATPVTQTKSVNPKVEEAITVTPDSGKLLNSVSIPQLILTSATTFGTSGYSAEKVFKPNRTLSLVTNGYGHLHIKVGELGWFLISLPPKSASSTTSFPYAINSLTYAEYHGIVLPGFAYTNSSGGTSYMNGALMLVKCTDITQTLYVIYMSGYGNKEVNNVYVWKVADL